eukprot:TRINITY_DN4469_c0_g1_i2.p1 TRINITY_DN4469_c0_g1~~TRINITY_DN4469_c0_g1_i2.p1  ORF type:complete len:234 (-),score=105.60 TRINITY_DN4469_c0_g1_i2:1559-2260(-)
MPQSRGTRRTTSKAAASSVVLDEETKKKCHSIIEDFDRQVLARIESSRCRMDNIYSQIRTKTNLLILQTPKDIQEKKLSAFHHALLHPETQGSLSESIPEEEESAMPPPEITANVIRKSKRTKKKTNKENLSVNSTRTTRSMTTPAHASKRGPGPTPMTIKTKFNIGTPLTKSICRIAKPDEPLISMSGSPVMLGGSAAPSGISDVIKELDDISKEKLLSIRSKINEALEHKK